MLITAANLPTDLPAITQFFRAYAASLPIDVGYQGFEAELASHPGKSPARPQVPPRKSLAVDARAR